MRADRIDQLPELPPRERIDAGGGRGGSVCLNRFSGLISGVPAVVTKMMGPAEAGPLELFFYLDP